MNRVANTRKTRIANASDSNLLFVHVADLEKQWLEIEKRFASPFLPADERILGSGEFVERILREADARALRQHTARKGNRYAERVVAEECKKSGVSLTELRSGSRRGRLPAVRTKIVRGLVENYGVGVAEIARQVVISTSGVSKILTRTLSN